MAAPLRRASDVDPDTAYPAAARVARSTVDTEFSIANRGLGKVAVAAPDYSTPGKLAAALDPTTLQTPALELIDRALVDVAEGRNERLIICMPPQEGKSERTTHYGALWFMHRDPNLRIGIVSYDGNMASTMSAKIRNDILTFDGFDGNLDLGLRLRRDSKAASRWVLDPPHRGGCYAIGIGGALTGRPVDVLFIDDPVKDYKAADSAGQSEAAWEWWQSVARPRLRPGAPVILILTRWHEKDLAGRLLAKQAQDEAAGLEHYDRWTVINIPAQADHDPKKKERDPLGRKPGEFMKSARGRTVEQWQATKAATGTRIWNALYQGRPSPDAGEVWKRHYWRRYSSPLWTTDGAVFRVDGFDQVIQSWDMTFKDTKGSDYVVGLVLGRRGPDVFVLDAVHSRMDFPATITAVMRMHVRWPQAHLKLIEDKANGSAVIDSLRRKIPGIVPEDPEGSKYARAVAVSPFIESGNTFLPTTEGADAVALFDAEALVDEAAAFPNGSHDDWVDALSQGLKRLLLGGAGAAEWTAFMRARAAAHADAAAAAKEPEPEPEPATGASALEAARQAAFAGTRRR